MNLKTVDEAKHEILRALSKPNKWSKQPELVLDLRQDHGVWIEAAWRLQDDCVIVVSSRNSSPKDIPTTYLVLKAREEGDDHAKA